MSLKDWADNGWLVQHWTSREEIADLFGLADRDLRNLKNHKGFAKTQPTTREISEFAFWTT